MQTTILQALGSVRKDPVSYLGEKSIRPLEAYLSGILDGLDSIGHKIQDISEVRFALWLARKNRISISKDLFSTLTLIAPSDSDAFDRFFTELTEFLKQQPGPTLWSGEFPSSSVAPKQGDLDLNLIMDQVRKRPFPLLRSKSLVLLYAYLNGHIATRKIVFGNVQCRPDLDEFASWLRARDPRLFESGHRHWVRVLKYMSLPEENESRAFDLFFEMREKWMNEGISGRPR